jgi:hypothetical protein
MLQMDDILSALQGDVREHLTFEPSTVDLAECFVSPSKSDEDDADIVYIEGQENWTRVQRIASVYPADTEVIAIDSTSFQLGQLPEGLVGAVRASVIIRPAGEVNRHLQLYGPYLFPLTNQNKDACYGRLYEVVHKKQSPDRAPDLTRIINRIRALIERAIQLKVMSAHKNSLILLDGSLIASTVGDPRSTIQRLVDEAALNQNSIVALSKSTRLTLQNSKRSITSLLDNSTGPCFVGGIKEHIIQQIEKYVGDIYVARLTSLGHIFRIDIPLNTAVSHGDIFAQIAGLAGEHGYPEELRLAHMTCVLSCIEILELQAAAMQLFGLTLEENLRQELFYL